MNKELFIHTNWALLGLMLLLFAIGVITIYSAGAIRVGDGIEISTHYQRQLLWGLLGFGGLLICVCFDYRNLRSFAWPFFILMIGLLALVPLIGSSAFGAKRWIAVAGFRFQPSEMAKIAVLLLAAHMLSHNKGPLSWRELYKVLIICAIPIVLILKQPDLGTALMTMLLLGGMILYRGIRLRVLLVNGLIVLLLLPVLWVYGMHDYQKVRVMAFIYPQADPRGADWQMNQAEIAIGSGEMWGKGFLEGTQSTLSFLPVKHTDFALAVLSEEWGFRGSICLLFLLCFFLQSICNTVREAKDSFGSFLAVGVFFFFYWQIVINMGMVLRLLPVVGIPLPFISYGGTALIVSMCLVGLVLNISMRRFLFKNG